VEKRQFPRSERLLRLRLRLEHVAGRVEERECKSLTDGGATMRWPNTTRRGDASGVHRLGRISVVTALPHPHRTLAR
jgi:hypothetical protein